MAQDMEMDDMEMDLDDKISQAAMADKEISQAAAPKGKFSKAGLNQLVAAIQPVLAAFGIQEAYPSFDSDQTELPVEFFELLTMIKSAVDDAIAAEALEPDMALDLNVVDDRGLKMLAGRMSLLAKSKPFKQFLKQPKAVTEMPAEEMVENEPVDEEALFRSRI
jgi:hypothetical protein